jgi:hypothetical protein
MAGAFVVFKSQQMRFAVRALDALDAGSAERDLATSSHI